MSKFVVLDLGGNVEVAHPRWLVAISVVAKYVQLRGDLFVYS